MARKERTISYLFMSRRKALSAETASCVLVIIASKCNTDRLTVATSFATLTTLCITYQCNNNIRLLKIDKPQLNTEMLKVKVIRTYYKHKTKRKTPSVTVSK